MSCYPILKNLYEPKMDMIPTISFKITAEIEITKHMCCVLLCRRGRVSAFSKAQLCSFIHLLPWNMRLHCFSLLITRLMRLAIILPAEVSWKRNKWKTFPFHYVISLCGVVDRSCRSESKVLGSNPAVLFIPSFFFFPFFALLFSINI